ncbi:N-acetyltransferase domain-containing protein [Candidatus Magnetomoraceae bacterium gMMP-15]
MEILYKYPKSVTLKDGSQLSIRPFRREDEIPLHEYFLRLPKKDRLWLKNDVSNPKVIERWVLDLDYDSVLPLIALDGDKIVANTTLQFSPIGWTKHQAEIRITCDLDYRKKGLATILVENLIEIATNFGLEQLTAEISLKADKSYFLFEKLDFKEAAVFKDFIKDHNGNYDDLIMMVKDI